MVHTALAITRPASDQLRLDVSISTQRLRLWDGFRLVKEWSVSTSKFGIGFTEGSNKTPVGAFFVKEKYGDGAPVQTIFKAREPVGCWPENGAGGDDLVLTRILRLAGAEDRNSNTYERYIYIHGTNDEKRIGQRSSHGCVRMRNAEIVELFNLVPEGTPVWISE